MSSRAAFAAAFGAIVVLALLPGPLRQLAGEGESGRAPDFDVPLDVGELLMLEPEVADDTLYVVVAGDRPPLEQGNLKAIGQLYLSRAIPVQDARRAALELSVRGRTVTLGRR